MENEKRTKKGEFVEIKFTGKAQGKIFDSNVPEDLKILDPNAKPKKTIVVIGENMVVRGLDSALENKELNKEYSISFPAKEGFGIRNRELVKTIPLSVFTQQKITPRPGATLLMDNNFVKIITISGARVVTDFNNPLAGKDLEYKFTITRKVDDVKEKSETFFELFFRNIPKFEISENAITVKAPKQVEGLIKMFADKFKELIGKDLLFNELNEETSTSPSKTPQ